MRTKLLTLISGVLLMSTINPAQSQNFNDHKLKNSVCESCHGQNGNSINSSLPHLAGQNEVYLIQQIKGFLAGKRKHPLLKPSSEKTSDTHIEALSAYYSKSKINNTSSALLTNSYSEQVKQGESIYSSCSGCHGIKAEGISPYPRLAGQQTDYLKQQLIHFKTGARKNTLMKMMTINLSDEDIHALSLYLSTMNKMKYKLGQL